MSSHPGHLVVVGGKVVPAIADQRVHVWKWRGNVNEVRRRYERPSRTNEVDSTGLVKSSNSTSVASGSTGGFDDR